MDWFLKQIQLRPGDGSSIRFWKDIWAGSTSLEADFPALFALARDKDGSVLSHRSGLENKYAWNLKLCRPLNDWVMAPMTVLRIDQVSFGLEGDADYRVWTQNKEGVFSVSSAYWPRLEVSSPFSLAKFIWKTKMPIKAAFLLWLVTLKKVLMVDKLQAQGIQLANRCCLCECHEETADHVSSTVPFLRSRGVSF